MSEAEKNFQKKTAWARLVDLIRPPEPIFDDTLQNRREYILHAILASTVFLSILAFIPATVFLLREEKFVMIAIDVLAIGAVAGLFTLKNRYYRLRAASITILFYIISIALLINIGPYSGAPIWLFSTAIIVSLLLGLKYAIVSLVINLIVLLAIGWFMGEGVISWHVSMTEIEVRWTSISANFFYLNTIAAISIAVLVKSLEGTINREKEISSNLEREHKNLVLAYERLAGEIEGRRQANKALLESERRFREMSDMLPQPVFEIDAEGRMTYLSEKGFQISGYEREDFWVGMWAEQLIIPEHRSRLKSRVAAAVKDKTSSSSEYTALKKDGTTFPVTVHSTPVIRDEQVVGLRGVIIDNTHRDMINAELRRQREFLEGIINSVSEGIFILDEQARYILINPACGRILNFRPDDWLGINAASIILEEERQKSADYYLKALNGEQVQLVMNVPDSEDNIRTLFIRLDPLVWKEKRHVLGVVTDITDRNRSEKELESALQEKEVLLREIHHRVKNNMAVISALISLQANNIDDPESQEVFNELRHRIMSMALIHELLYQSTTLVAIDLEQYISRLSDTLFQAYSTTRRSVTMKSNAKGVTINVDQAIPCGLILNEIISNSLKYAFPDGLQGEINVTAFIDDGNKMNLEISDNGVGIPEDTDWRNQNTLGLSMVANLVEKQLKGSLDLDRSGGTRFSIRFGVK